MQDAVIGWGSVGGVVPREVWVDWERVNVGEDMVQNLELDFLGGVEEAESA